LLISEFRLSRVVIDPAKVNLYRFSRSHSLSVPFSALKNHSFSVKFPKSPVFPSDSTGMNTQTRHKIGQAILETLEERRMMSSVELTDGIFIVRGAATRANELAVHTTHDGSQMWAETNGDLSQIVSTSSVRQIRIIGGEKNDSVNVDAGISIPVLVRTGDGKDAVSTGKGDDTIFAGNGRDTINSGPGDDRVNAGNGNDSISTGAGRDAVDGGNGSDAISGGKGADTISGNSGDDSLAGAAGNDRIATNKGVDFARGGKGNDTIIATSGDDIYGDEGDDTLDRGDLQNPPSNGNGNNDNGGTDEVTVLPVKDFSLINSDTNEAIPGYEHIKGNVSIDLESLPTRRLNLRANFDGEFAGSVWFGLNEVEQFTIESKAPYSFKHDLYGDYYNWKPKAGVYNISATTYSAEAGTGTKGDTTGVKFTFTDSATDTGGTDNGGNGNGGNGSGGNGGNGGNTGGTDNSGTTIDDGSGKDAPNGVIKLITSGNVQEGHSVHVSALESDLKGGSVLGMKYEWNFGDAGTKYNALRGFNASHVYENAGEYTVTLKITDAKGRSDTTKVTVNIANSSRKVIYVSNEGDDSNSGRAPSLAVRTISKAQSLVDDNTEILFKRGDRFTMTNGLVVDQKNNVVIGAYGNGDSPVLFWNTANKPSGFINMIALNKCTNATVRDLTFDSKFSDKGKNNLTSVRPSGTNLTVLNNTFLNVTEGVNSNFQPTGLLVQGNDAPTFLRGGFSWCSGFYLVYLGNHVNDSSQENAMRVSGDGTRNLLFAYNDIRDTYKGSLVIQKSQYVYAYGNTLRGEAGSKSDAGKVEIGPLAKKTGEKGSDQRTKYVVFEENLVTDHSQIQVHHGSEHVVVRNNVIKSENLNFFTIEGYNREYQRSVKNVTITSNTVINNGTHGRFLLMGGPASEIAVTNNLYVAPNLEIGKYAAAAMYIQQSDLRSFRVIDNNVWPSPGDIASYYEGGINFLGSNASKAAWRNANEWNAQDEVGTDKFTNINLADSYSTKIGAVFVGSIMSKAA